MFKKVILSGMLLISSFFHLGINESQASTYQKAEQTVKEKITNKLVIEKYKDGRVKGVKEKN